MLYLLAQLDLSCNGLQSVRFLKVIENTLTLKRLNFSNNKITDAAAIDMGVILSHNTALY